MTRQPNPYRPGFNQAPAVLVGREQLLEDVTEALEVAAYDHRTPRPLVLIGPRGVGKTVTLGEAAVLAGRTLSWPTVHVEAKPRGFLRDLVARLLDVASQLEGAAPAGPAEKVLRPSSRTGRRGRLSGGALSAQAFGVGVGGEVRFEDQESAALKPVEQLEAALQHVAQVAISRDAGVLLTLDELHTADREDLGVLAALLQEHVPDHWPLVVLAAGLPSLRHGGGKRRLPTYLERAEWHHVDSLDLDDARRALSEPAAQAGRPMTSEAVEELLGQCGGYPYAIQVAGHFAWRASSGAEEISAEHARAARPRIDRDLGELFASRWEDASRKEREYLVALAQRSTADSSATGADVADALGKGTKEVSYLRDRLIKKGVIWSTTAGELHFITPGMGQWVRERST